jgi:hypothetical protein
MRSEMPTLRIESDSRWDALALTRKLARYHWFMVEPDLEHWDICVALSDDVRDDVPRDIRKSVLDWLNERHLERATIHCPSAAFVLTRK